MLYGFLIRSVLAYHCNKLFINTVLLKKFPQGLPVKQTRIDTWMPNSNSNLSENEQNDYESEQVL